MLGLAELTASDAGGGTGIRTIDTPVCTCWYAHVPRPDPRYLQIVGVLEEEIRGAGPNALLPTEQQFAARFGVSRVTIRRALGLLERGGRVSRLPGRGTIVSPPKVTRRFVPFCVMEQDFREQGIKLDTQLVAYEPRVNPPAWIEERLGPAAGDSMGHLVMIRSVNGHPLCHDERYLAPSVAARFDPGLVRTHSLSDLLQELAHGSITVSDVETEIAPAPRDVARPLSIIPGMLVIINRFTEYVGDGEPLEFGTVSYRVDRVKFRMVIPGRADAATPDATPGRGPATNTGS